MAECVVQDTMMAPDQREQPHEESNSHPEAGTGTSSVTRRSEEIHIRNFDVTRAYDLTIEVRDSQGLVFANRYYLEPGATVSELGRLPPGVYDVRVELDGRRSVTCRCEIDDTPDRTALIEVGNGTVSVTEGLYQ